MPRPFRVLLTIAALTFAVSAIAMVWRQNREAAGLDFYIYFVNAQLASRSDIENIYAPDVQERVGEEYYERAQRSDSERRKYDAGRRRRLDNVSSPFLYTTLGWVSRDYDSALLQYHVLLLGAFVGGVLLLGRRARLPIAVSLFLVGLLLFWYRGFEADLRVGNVNSLQLFAIGLMLVVPFPSVIAGALLAFKPNLLFVVLLLLAARVIRRDWAQLRRELIGGAIGGAGAFVITAIHYGTPRVWLDWLTAANQFWHRFPTRMERNVAPALQLIQEHGTWVSYTIAAMLTVVVLIALARARHVDESLVVAAGLLIYLLSATVVWLHYMVLVVPAAIALMRWRATALVALLALAAIAEEPFELLFRQPAFPVETWLITPSLVALFLAIVWKIATGVSAPDPSPKA